MQGSVGMPALQRCRLADLDDASVAACSRRLPSVQISAAKLTEMDPMAREAAQGARAALGNDYEQQLRKEAGPMPGKLSKRKHQIGSLFHQAKLAVSL